MASPLPERPTPISRQCICYAESHVHLLSLLLLLDYNAVSFASASNGTLILGFRFNVLLQNSLWNEPHCIPLPAELQDYEKAHAATVLMCNHCHL